MAREFGLWPPNAGDSDAGATPLCVAQFRLEAGNEALIGQLGSEVFAGVSSGGVGDYWLLIDAAFQAVLLDASALYLSLALGDTAPRFAMLTPNLAEGYIAVAASDDAGVPAAINRLWITVYYDTDAPPT